MWWVIIVFSASESIGLCMLHCAIPTAAKYITDLINLLKSIVVIVFEIIMVGLVNDLVYKHYRTAIYKLFTKLLYLGCCIYSLLL